MQLSEVILSNKNSTIKSANYAMLGGIDLKKCELNLYKITNILNFRCSLSCFNDETLYKYLYYYLATISSD